MAVRRYGPAPKQKKAIISGGVAFCVVTLILTITASVMTVKYLNSSADWAFAAMMTQYQAGIDLSGAIAPGPSQNPVADALPDDLVRQPGSLDTFPPPLAGAESALAADLPAEGLDDAASSDGGEAGSGMQDAEATVAAGSEQVPAAAEPSGPPAQEPPVQATHEIASDKATQAVPPAATEIPVQDGSSGGDGAGDALAPDATEDPVADGPAGGSPLLEPVSPSYTDGIVVSYVVKSGDTLMRVAQRFGVDMDAIVTANGIENPNLIFVGQVLEIPGAKADIGPVSPNTGPED